MKLKFYKIFAVLTMFAMAVSLFALPASAAKPTYKSGVFATESFGKYLGYDNFAGAYVGGKNYYVMVTDEAAAIVKTLQKYPDFNSRPVTFILAEYSQNQLDSTKTAFEDKWVQLGLNESHTDVKTNRVIVDVKKITTDVIKFKQSLPYGGCVTLTQSGDVITVDVAVAD